MAILNTKESYGNFTKIIHYILMFSVLGMLLVGAIMGDLPKSISGQVYVIHKLCGLAVLTLMVIFALWSLSNPKPGYPNDMPIWQQHLAKTTQALLYISLILMPISGWVMSTAAGKAPHLFGVSLPMPGIPQVRDIARTASNLHEIIAWTITGLLLLHVTGALKHYFLDKNNLLQRMLKF